MCTAVSYVSGNHYFGRNLDYDRSFGEKITITPKRFPFSFLYEAASFSHYAIMGTAAVSDGYPLYFDAVNEKGLSAAGLLFKDNAFYNKPKKSAVNLASFEFIPYVLSLCKNLSEAKTVISKLNITDDSFSENMPASPLHWIFADKSGSITVEAVKDGVLFYDNPVGILTNNPPFPLQLFNLNNYMSLSSDSAQNTFSEKIELSAYSRGMGALGLPGDLSSASRFVRAAFTKLNSVCSTDEKSSVSQFFHILDSVFQTRGLVKVGSSYEITLYSSCCNTDKGIYYFKTYDGFNIQSIDMHSQDLSGTSLLTFPFE